MSTIDSDILAIEPQLIETRRHFHAHPEASLKEFETAKYIREKLDAWGIPYTAVGETGTLGVLQGGKPGPTVLLRGDIDALDLQELNDVPYRSQYDGLCHACGHDAHASALLYAAYILRQRQDQLPGTVKLAFQQAEEVGAGARLFVSEGHLNDVDLAFGQHVTPALDAGTVQIQAGPINASVDFFKIHVHGKGAHAAAPNQGRDAALASAAILVHLQNIASRRVSPNEPIILSIGKLVAGTRFNVVAEEGLLEGTLRTLNTKRRDEYVAFIEDQSRAIAEAYGCTVTFENVNAANVLENDPQAAAYIRHVAEPLFAPGHILTNLPASMGGEDFADISQATKAAFAYIGTKKDAATGVINHNGHFNIDESQLKVMVQLHVNVAMHADTFGDFAAAQAPASVSFDF
ncbi:MAG: amidohydrolase [Peptoniphilaceae bacterium]|nr:amidohydrolase [Peptoniphilaceae bacterium]MDY6085681.1 amidohydrolase [Peptoniphilaceae bacterium]